LAKEQTKSKFVVPSKKPDFKSAAPGVAKEAESTIKDEHMQTYKQDSFYKEKKTIKKQPD